MDADPEMTQGQPGRMEERPESANEQAGSEMTSEPDFENLEETEREERVRMRRSDPHPAKPKKRWGQVRAQLAETGNSPSAWKAWWPSTLRELRQEVSEPQRNVDEFVPSFTGSRHEREWIITYLGGFYHDHQIVDVLHTVKGGKEATVYCCRAHPSMGVDLIAAKVYRPRQFRRIRNDALYRQGRETVDQTGKEVRKRRDKLAMAKKTEFGHELLHATWLQNEYAVLRTLHQAGVSVPRPLAASENAILMEYVGAEKAPAPTLHHTRLAAAEAGPLFERLIHDVEVMLAHDVVHGDLSAYNVLYWRGEYRIIDLPQAVDPRKNPHAFTLLHRDLQRLCEYFARYGVAANAYRLADRFWSRHILLQG